MMRNTLDRFTRQLDVVPMDSIMGTKIAVVGCGAVGRQIALMLAQLGTRKMVLCDPDRIEDHNVSSQGWQAKDIGRMKVEVLGKECTDIHGGLAGGYDSYLSYEMVINGTFYTLRDRGVDVIISALDSMEVRKDLWPHIVSACPNLYIDTRMGAESIEVYTLQSTEGVEGKAYTQTLLWPTAPDRCTARTTVYGANMAAVVALQQYTKWLRGDQDHNELPGLVRCNMRAWDLDTLSIQARVTDPVGLEGGEEGGEGGGGV